MGNPLTRFAKRVASTSVAAVGRTGAFDFAERFVLDRLVPLFLDPQVHRDEITTCTLRGYGVRVPCHPYNFFHRRMFWLGKPHEAELVALLQRALRPGDRFIDVGSNYGHYAFLAAALVGPTGLVHAVEPHPRLAKLIEDHARAQGLASLQVHCLALGDTTGTIALRVNPRHIGASTVRFADGASALASGFVEEYQVPLRRADDISEFAGDPRGTVMKIDVEGNEPATLRGARKLLENSVDCLFIEVTPDWVGGAAGVADLFAQMHAAGFVAHRFASDFKTLQQAECRPGDITQQENVVFGKPAFLKSRNFLR